jgi:hypothetical protein
VQVAALREALPRLAPGLTRLQICPLDPGRRGLLGQATGLLGLHQQQEGARCIAAVAALAGLRQLSLPGGPGGLRLQDCGQLAALSGLRALDASICRLDVASLPCGLTSLVARGVQHVADTRPAQAPEQQGWQGRPQEGGGGGGGTAPQLLHLSLSLDTSFEAARPPPPQQQQQKPPLRTLLPCLARLRSLSLDPGPGGSAEVAEGLQLLSGLCHLRLPVAAAGGLRQLLRPLRQLTCLELEGVGSKSSQGAAVDAASELTQLRLLKARPALVPWRSKTLRALQQAMPRCELLVEPHCAL